MYPEIAKEWHPIKNGSLSPENVRYASGKKIWWLCSKCSNEWVMTVNQRALRGQGCPECGKIKRVTSFNKSIVKERGSLVQHHPELLADWDYEKNSINPNDVSNASNKKYIGNVMFVGMNGVLKYRAEQLVEMVVQVAGT